ncbi:MAG: phosphatase PAP2 family protein [Chloroflexi bacterium]|nr:phosphatase PAP2 family protein [Chloroflexota bacterium]
MSEGAVPPIGSGALRVGSESATAETALPIDGTALVDPHEGLGTRNDRLLLSGVVAYVALLSALMIARGIAVTPDVLLVAMGLAAALLGRGRLFLRDWVPFIALFFAYELMRGYADDLGAAVHVTDIIALERLLHLGALPTEVLQHWFRPAAGSFDAIAVMATIVYFLHFPLPLAIGFLLWLRRRRVFYDYVAALIVLCLAGFATYLVLPVAPPWWAAERGALAGPDGLPLVAYLKPEGFEQLASALGFDGRYLYTYTFYQVAPNPVAAFPSLHAAFPFLAFLFAHRAFGRVGWLVFGYFLAVVFAIVYLADHYLVDAYAGVIYAAAAAWAVLHAPAGLRRLLDRARDGRLERSPQVLAPGEGSERRGVDRPVLVQGVFVAGLGVLAIALLLGADQAGSPLMLAPWALLLGGAWRAAVGLLRS